MTGILASFTHLQFIKRQRGQPSAGPFPTRVRGALVIPGGAYRKPNASRVADPRLTHAQIFFPV